MSSTPLLLCTHAPRSVSGWCSRFARIVAASILAILAIVTLRPLGAQELSYPIQFLDSTATNPPVFSIRTLELEGVGPKPFQIGFLDSVEATAPQRDRADSTAPSKAPPVSPSDSVAAAPLRVLFIGNSFTYYNAMPRIFASLAASGAHRRVVVGLVSVPGGPTGVMWTLTDLPQVIRRLPWDVIVLQLRPITFPDPSLGKYVALFRDAANEKKARLIVWAQYGMPALSAKDNAAFDTFIEQTAQEARVPLVNIPRAWDAVKQADSAMWKRLYWSESDTHPSPLGSYVLSLVFYKAILGSAPAEFPRTAGGVTISDAEASALTRITF